MSIYTRMNGNLLDLEWVGDVAKPNTALGHIGQWLWNHGISYCPSMFIDENTVAEPVSTEEYGEKFHMEENFGHVTYIRWQFEITTDKVNDGELVAKLKRKMRAY